jgi:HlyD family secretion protein
MTENAHFPCVRGLRAHKDAPGLPRIGRQRPRKSQQANAAWILEKKSEGDLAKRPERYIISRMINNSVRTAMLFATAMTALVGACAPKEKHAGELQGVIELDERALGFEVGGRLTVVNVRRGSAVHAGDVLAKLDDTLERTASESREAEARAAQASVALIRAGSRPEEVRSMQAQLRAAQASESLLEKNLEREKSLFQQGAVAVASVDDLESRLRAATASRQALEQRLRELQNGARREEIARAEAEASVASQQVKLGGERVERYVLRATSDGTVLDVHADPTEVVAAGAPVFTMADTKHPYVDVFVPQAELGGIHVDSRARVVVDAGPHPFTGSVEYVAQKTEFTPRYLFSDRERGQLVVRVRVRVDDPEEALHAGVPAFVTIDRFTPAGIGSAVSR